MTKVAVLDDWQDVAESGTDWSPLMAVADVVFFKRAFNDEDAAVLNLTDFGLRDCSYDARTYSAAWIVDQPATQTALARHHGFTKCFARACCLHRSRRDGLQHGWKR
jgi:hypothetical protein